MTTTEMLSKLNGISTARSAAKAKELNDKRAQMEKNLKAAEKLLPKIFELGPVVKRLVELGVGIEKKSSIFAHSKFLTDSINHNLGFCGRTDKFGYCAGGACGDYDLVAHLCAGEAAVRWSIRPDTNEFLTAKQFAEKYFDKSYFLSGHAARMAKEISKFIADVESAVADLQS